VSEARPAEVSYKDRYELEFTVTTKRTRKNKIQENFEY
jgi:hypothetical protein